MRTLSPFLIPALALVACDSPSHQADLEVEALVSEDARAAMDEWPVAVVATIEVDDGFERFTLGWTALGVLCDPADELELVGHLDSAWGPCREGEARVRVELARVTDGACTDDPATVEWSLVDGAPMGLSEPLPLRDACTALNGEVAVAL